MGAKYVTHLRVLEVYTHMLRAHNLNTSYYIFITINGIHTII